MHIDEGKKFDKRNVQTNIKSGIITRKDYEIHISKLPDAGDKVFDPEGEESESIDEMELEKKEGKKKVKKKGK